MMQRRMLICSLCDRGKNMICNVDNLNITEHIALAYCLEGRYEGAGQVQRPDYDPTDDPCCDPPKESK